MHFNFAGICITPRLLTQFEYILNRHDYHCHIIIIPNVPCSTPPRTVSIQWWANLFHALLLIKYGVRAQCVHEAHSQLNINMSETARRCRSSEEYSEWDFALFHQRTKKNERQRAGNNARDVIMWWQCRWHWNSNARRIRAWYEH